MGVILYSTGCLKCGVIKKKLIDKNVEFEEVNDKDEMIKKGIEKVPMLEINGNLMDFVSSNDWVNSIVSE